ncbi:MAG TPA: hypothetical protein VFI70_13540 [Nitrososphaeraceae archaeon]|nr:hypothetical protein [Nitrososphaeraceae archaeon]
MSTEQIKKISANTGKDEFQNAVYFMKGKIDLESFLTCFEARMNNSSIQVIIRSMPIAQCILMLSNRIDLLDFMRVLTSFLL